MPFLANSIQTKLKAQQVNFKTNHLVEGCVSINKYSSPDRHFLLEQEFSEGLESALEHVLNSINLDR